MTAKRHTVFFSNVQLKSEREMPYNCENKNGNIHKRLSFKKSDGQTHIDALLIALSDLT